MILKGIDFGRVWGASGVKNFFGNGYWFHWFLYLIGMWFWKVTFVAKTTTLTERKGNMPLKKDGTTPTEWFPKCVYVDFKKGIVLNAVGLSGRGLFFLLETGKWQKRKKPFFISFMSTKETTEGKIKDAELFGGLLAVYRRKTRFAARFGIQVNLSCPNVGTKPHSPHEFVTEAHAILQALRNELPDVPLVVKLSITTEVSTASMIAEHHACDAICVSNTIPWGNIRIDWKKLFGSDISPLTQRGFEQPGGLSGKPLLPLVEAWIREATNTGFPKPINAGGGILGPKDAIRLLNAGAQSVSLGSIAILRGWNVFWTILAVRRYFAKRRK